MLRFFSLAALLASLYAAYQLLPVWFPSLSGPRAEALRRRAVMPFVDALLIAYPVAVVVSALGAVILVYLNVRAGSARRPAE